MVRRMRLAENDEFQTHDGISKINSIFKIKWELYNGAYIKRTLRKTVNDDSEMCDSILYIGYVLGVIGLRENFTVRAPNCCCDDKRYKTCLKR